MIRALILAIVAMTYPVSILAQDAPVSETLRIEGIAAVVNDAPITYFDVRQRTGLLMIGIATEPTEELFQQATSQALDQLIDEQLQLQEASEYDVVIDDSDIADALNNMANKAGTNRDVLYADLLASGINPISLEEQMRAEISWRRIMAGLYGSRIRVSKTQIDDKLDQIEINAQDIQYLLSEIFLYVGQVDEQEQARAAASAIVAQLREGASFPVAAQRLSSASTASIGGDMGWVSVKDINPQAVIKLNQLSEPGIIDPIEVENGVYIYMLRGKQDPEDTSSAVNLRQLVAVNGSMSTLEDALDGTEGCGEIDVVADDNANLMAVTLGEIDVAILKPEMQTRIESTAVGAFSETYIANAGPTAIFVCDRSAVNNVLPTRDQIEDIIYGEQLGMISERALRNIKRDATIIRR